MEPISADGVYNISLEQYHNNPNVCVGPSISSGGLRVIENKSPLHFYNQWAGNPDAEKIDTAGMIFGRAAHAYSLGDEVFLSKFAILPYPDFRTNAAKEWKEKMEANGKAVLKQEQVQDIVRMATALRAHPVVKLGLLDGWQEISLIWKDKETGVWLKSRPDLVARDLMGGDYKTTNDASDDKLQRALVEYSYHQQAALVCEAYEHVLGLKLKDFALIFQEKTAPFAVNPILLSPDAIARGRVLNRRAIRIFADCLERGIWPGYPERTTPVDLPEYYNKRFDYRQENDLLPSYYEAGVTITDDRRREDKPITDPLA